MSEYQELKRRYTALSKERDVAQGKREVYETRLKESGYATIQAAQEKIQELDGIIEQLDGRIAERVEKLKGILDA